MYDTDTDTAVWRLATELTIEQARATYRLARAFGHGWATALTADEAIARLTSGASVAPEDPNALQGPYVDIHGTVGHTSGAGSVSWSVTRDGTVTVWIGHPLATLVYGDGSGDWEIHATPPDTFRGDRGSSAYALGLVRTVAEALGVPVPDTGWSTRRYDAARALDRLAEAHADLADPMREVVWTVRSGMHD